jgi:amino acid transporter
LIVCHYFPAIRLYKSRNCDDDKDDDDFCDRTVFAISIGVVSGCVAFIWMICGTRLPAIADVILGWLMLIAWIFAVGYITFGDDDASPAKNIGNLYFVTWTGFIISCLVASSSLRAMFVTVGFGGGGDEGESTTEEAKPERAADEENVLAVDEEKVSSEDAPVDDEVAVNR